MKLNSNVRVEKDGSNVWIIFCEKEHERLRLDEAIKLSNFLRNHISKNKSKPKTKLRGCE